MAVGERCDVQAQQMLRMTRVVHEVPQLSWVRLDIEQRDLPVRHLWILKRPSLSIEPVRKHPKMTSRSLLS